MKIEKVFLPNIPESSCYPSITKKEVNAIFSKIMLKIEEKSMTHLIIYGDREHFANLSYVTGGYDSRFEESLLIIQKNESPVLITGNEGYSYSDICLLDHEKELFQTFSLQGQTRDKKKHLGDILKKYGLNSKSRIGIVGLKYYEKGESSDPEHTFDIPHYIIQEVIKFTPFEQIFNATDIFTHPENGLRSCITHHEIARFEFMSNYLSNQMKKMIKNLKIGISETEVASNFEYMGVPFSTHTIVNFGTERVLMGLASPTFNKRLKKGDMVNLAFGTAGANVARTGCAVSSETDFSGNRKNIITDFYYPYFEALKLWYELLNIGESTNKVYDKVMGIIGDKKFGVTLNVGHQIHLEEWSNSPFRTDYDYRLKSGMAFQCDIIAFPGEPYVGIHVEDTVVLADGGLRSKLKSEYRETWERIKRRREMMKNTLGILIGEDVLPLSNIQAVLYPFLLNPDYVITS